MPLDVVTVVAARPNFMKVAPVHQALAAAGHACRMVHTGQHYDAAMSEVFFRDLGMPEPAVNLQVGSGSHAQQTARIMQLFEPVLLAQRPDWLVVAGDVNSTLACALVASKVGVRVAHLEAGLRSGDRAMPEEINRRVVDTLSDALLTPSPDADANLLREGHPPQRIRCVGNAMIDSVRQHAHTARARQAEVMARWGLQPPYALATLHRPNNVDDAATLRQLVRALEQVNCLLPVLFVVHPRTRAALQGVPTGSLRLCEPLGYIDFLALHTGARMLLTDSGGLQEESTALGVPCLTLRDGTERPVTVSEGTNTLVGTTVERILATVQEVLLRGGKAGRVPALWDGRAAQRVTRALEDMHAA